MFGAVFAVFMNPYMVWQVILQHINNKWKIILKNLHNDNNLNYCWFLYSMSIILKMEHYIVVLCRDKHRSIPGNILLCCIRVKQCWTNCVFLLFKYCLLLCIYQSWDSRIATPHISFFGNRYLFNLVSEIFFKMFGTINYLNFCDIFCLRQ